ncbi:hypothetical protein P3T76_007970 [Phytophthora citrophthora]|uniref:Uncharacterized protein n=1 Tax=Phytophthora citrophthora TaxID=4793 RepID=A0AAD9GLC6_9STRA|nr:hypothetical protein P3T76_007970 [Phytophthora citrophthora]
MHEQDSDALLSRLFRRCRCTDQPDSRLQSTKKYGNELQTLAVTNVHELSRELLATERAIHLNPVTKEESASSLKQTTSCPAWNELEEIFRELHDLYERNGKFTLSRKEEEYVNVLTQSAVKTLVQACLSTDRGDLEAAGVRVKLLEVAVRPTAHWRRLAFTLLLNISVASLATILSTQEASLTKAQQLEENLFKLLREMLGKAVICTTSLASNSPDQHLGSDWIEEVLGCLEFFVKKVDGNYSSERLRALDEHSLLFLAAEASNGVSLGSELELKAMELVVATMYAFKVVPAGKSMANEWQPTKDHSVWNCGLPIAAVEKYLSIELVLYHFYSSLIAQMQRLVSMVLVDVVCEQLRRTGSREAISSAGLDQLWQTFVDWEDPIRQILLSPYVSSARVVKQLTVKCPMIPATQLNAFVNQFRVLTQVDAYFGVNPSLDQAVKSAKTHGNTIQEILDQVMKQLLSHRVVERFRGERWLAELLSFSQDDDVFSTYDSKATTAIGSVCKQPQVLLIRPKRASASPAGEELEETFCYDEGADISTAAQAKFWELAAPNNPLVLRENFSRVLVLFVHRKLQLSSGKPDATTIEEVNTCLRVLLDHKETECVVLIPVMLLILDICQCELSYIDKRWKQRDLETFPNNEEGLDRVAWSDSLASRVLNGVVALDKTLLRQFDSEFFLHLLNVLQDKPDTHQGFECRRLCCGASTTLMGDVVACAALILTFTLSDSAVLNKVGGLTAVTPFLQACDTRIAVFMAKLICEVVKQADEDQYAEFLRELYVACVEADDEGMLYNSYLHTQALLYDVDRLQ